MTGDFGNRENSKGPTHSDRILAGEVRNLLLKEIKEIILKKEGLTKEEHLFRSEILLRMSGQLLPRLNELSGEDGGDIKVNIINYGSHYPIQLDPRNSSVGSPAKSFKVQSPDVAPESTQDDIGNQ